MIRKITLGKKHVYCAPCAKCDKGVCIVCGSKPNYVTRGCKRCVDQC